MRWARSSVVMWWARSSVVVGAALLVPASCTTRDPLYCEQNEECSAGHLCNVATRTCEQASIDGGDARGDGLDESGSSRAHPCKAAGDCPGGFCVDGLCCASACTGPCETCAAPGKEGTCTLRVAGTACAPSSCEDGVLEAHTCDGVAASCPSAKSPCDPYRCNAAGTACASSCATHAECTSGLCELSTFWGAAKQHACVSGEQICYADRNIACPGHGTSVDPYCTIQACLDHPVTGGTFSVVVAHGAYSESLTVKSKVAIVATAAVGPLLREDGSERADAHLATLAARSGVSAISCIGNHALRLVGFEVAGASDSLPTVDLQTSSQENSIETCHIGYSKSACVAIDATGQHVALTDVSIGVCDKGISSSGAEVTLSRVRISSSSTAGLATRGGLLRSTDLWAMYNAGAGVQIGDDTVYEIDRARLVKNGREGLSVGNRSQGTLSNMLVSGNTNQGLVFAAANGETLLHNVTVVDNGNPELICSGSAAFYNSIVWDQRDAGIISGESCGFDYSAVKGGAPGLANTLSDPLFAGSSSAEPYSVTADSPCVDTGLDVLPGRTIPAQDLLHLPRKVDKSAARAGTIDMGAFEVQ